ncbi:MAG: YqgE/AlgH family protein, partial [Pseudomonadota bacterium]
LGYSGWASGQLEDEISSNGWLMVDATDHILFDCSNEEKYRKSLALLGVDESLLSADAGHA